MNTTLEAIFCHDSEYAIGFSRIIIMNVNQPILYTLYSLFFAQFVKICSSLEKFDHIFGFVAHFRNLIAYCIFDLVILVD